MWIEFHNFCARLLVVFREFALDIYNILGTQVELPFSIGTFAVYEALFVAFSVTLVARFVISIINPD